MNTSILPGFVAALFAASALPSFAQQEAPPSLTLPMRIDAGSAENLGRERAVVLSFPVSVEHAPWMRLQFEEVQLSGDVAQGPGSMLRITSLLDGHQQRLNAEHVAQWQKSSAYFNGDTLFVEVLAYPQTGTNRVVLKEVTVGTDWVFEESQCGPTDDRVLSSDPRAARILPAGCTGWLINDACGCFLTAGHCTFATSTVQFNVPLSTASGNLVNPPPEHQYAVDQASLQSNGGQGVGNDWGYFGVFPNSNTGLTPFQAQGSTFALVPPPAFAGGQTIRITGYGTDSTPNQNNQVQQTHSGPRVNATGTTLSYQADTEGGNSGSPVIFESTGQAIGIHTHAGCGTTTGNNGTASTHAGLQAALANPSGVCRKTAPPVADFSATPTSGFAPLVVAFTDLSTNQPTSRSWSFGDGGSSTTANPSHTYNLTGTYTVSLTATNSLGSDTETKVGYIVVTDGPDASATPFNGSGVNPNVFVSLTLPIVGTTWSSQILAGQIGGSGISLVLGYTGTLQVLTSFGELLIDVSSTNAIVGFGLVLGGVANHAFNVPNDSSLLGVFIATQGYIDNVGGQGKLVNAIHLVLGN